MKKKKKKLTEPHSFCNGAVPTLGKFCTRHISVRSTVSGVLPTGLISDPSTLKHIPWNPL